MATPAVDDDTYILIGSELSYFAAKIRAYLTWKHIPFKQTLATRSTIKNIIHPLTGTHYVPVLITPKRAQRNGAPKAIQDTREMVRYLEATHPPGKDGMGGHSVWPEDPELRVLAAWCEVLGDQWLTIQGRYWMLSPDILTQQQLFIETELEDTLSGGAFPRASLSKSTPISRPAMSPSFSTILDPLGITPSTATAIRHQFTTLLTLLSTHFTHHPFLLGRRISLADFSFYACFHAHLSRNPAPGIIMKTTAPRVYAWVERVGGLARAGSANGGVVVPKLSKGGEIEWVDPYTAVKPDSGVPETLKPVLELLMGDYVPHLAESCRLVEEYISQQVQRKRRSKASASAASSGAAEREAVIDIPLPRYLEWQEFRMRSGKPGLEARGRRRCQPHAVWMCQQLVREVGSGEKALEGILGRGMVHGAWARCVEFVQGEWEILRVRGELVARVMVGEKERGRL